MWRVESILGGSILSATNDMTKLVSRVNNPVKIYRWLDGQDHVKNASKSDGNGNISRFESAHESNDNNSNDADLEVRVLNEERSNMEEDVKQPRE